MDEFPEEFDMFQNPIAPESKEESKEQQIDPLISVLNTFTELLIKEKKESYFKL